MTVSLLLNLQHTLDASDPVGSVDRLLELAEAHQAWFRLTSVDDGTRVQTHHDQAQLQLPRHALRSMCARAAVLIPSQPLYGGSGFVRRCAVTLANKPDRIFLSVQPAPDLDTAAFALSARECVLAYRDNDPHRTDAWILLDEIRGVRKDVSRTLQPLIDGGDLLLHAAGHDDPRANSKLTTAELADILWDAAKAVVQGRPYSPLLTELW